MFETSIDYALADQMITAEVFYFMATHARGRGVTTRGTRPRPDTLRGNRLRYTSRRSSGVGTHPISPLLREAD
jgi:hypothetical protein